MDDPRCNKCHGSGVWMYPNTALNMGIGGQMMMEGPCPGTTNRPDLSDCPFVEDNPYKRENG